MMTKKALKNLTLVFLFGVIAALSLNACSLFPTSPAVEDVSDVPIPAVVADTSVVSEGNLVPRDFQHLSFGTGGKIAEILVEVGDKVIEGQVLAHLGDREQAEAGLASAELEEVAAGQAYDDLLRSADLARADAWLVLIDARDAFIAAGRAWDEVDTDAFQDKIDDAKVAAEDAHKELEDAIEEFDKYIDLDKDNPTRKGAEQDLEDAQGKYDEAARAQDELINQYERAQASLELAQAAQAEAQRKYEAVQDGPDPDQLELVEARLANAQAQLSAAQAALDRYELKAPFAGSVVEVNVSPNELVSPDTWVILIADFSEWYVETNDLTELEVVDVEIGQGVSLVPDALPEVELDGEVVEISQVFIARGGDILYTVRILVDEIDPRLLWGMTVEVSFYP